MEVGRRHTKSAHSFYIFMRQSNIAAKDFIELLVEDPSGYSSNYLSFSLSL